MSVVLAKKEIDAGEKDLTVAVDNSDAVEHLKQLASNSGVTARTEKSDEGWRVIFSQGAESDENIPSFVSRGGYTVIFGNDTVGSGDQILGNSLAKMMLYTFSEDDDAPECIIFINNGVKLAASEKLDVVRSLMALEQKGTQILIDGTSLNYYGLFDKVKQERVSNMYEIINRLKNSDRVITL